MDALADDVIVTRLEALDSWTLAAGGLTDRDFELAELIDAHAARLLPADAN